MSLRFAILVVGFGLGWLQPGIAFSQVVVQGVYIDADGVLQTVAAGERSDQLDRLRERMNARRPSVEVSAPSKLRKLSLARLCRTAKRQLEQGQDLAADVLCLAGINRVETVLLLPDHSDVIVAGPAEAWGVAPDGRIVGRTSGRPVIQFDDLTVAARTFTPDRPEVPVVGCSINHTQEGLARLNRYMAGLGRSLDRRRVNRRLLEGVRNALGLQNVEIFGVPPDTRLARVLVEADYRMKLIGIGLEAPRVRGIVSYTSLIRAATAGTNRLQRWWFVPEYKSIQSDAAARHYALAGPRVRLMAADDAVSQDGQVKRKKTADRNNRQFVQKFSARYEELAKAKPVFADLQNVVDLVVLAAILQIKQRTDGARFPLEVLYDSTIYEPESVPTPRQVLSVVNYRWIGSRLAMPVGGGVVLEPYKLLKEQESAAATRPQIELPSDPLVWWWD